MQVGEVTKCIDGSGERHYRTPYSPSRSATSLILQGKCMTECQHVWSYYPSTKERQCTICLVLEKHPDDAKLTEHRRKSGIGVER